jgi:redox-sensing transcriptional repressor
MEQYNNKYISKAVIRRLPRYFRYLREMINNDVMRISSGELSQKMGLTASQIRQDLNCFGGFGQQGYGYNVKHLYEEISKILGVHKKYNAIIVGVGNLGKALINTPMFEKRGVTVTGLFDVDENTVGKTYGKHTVLHIDSLKDFFEKNDVAIGIITVPRDQAAKTANNLAKLGIKGLWNFSNAEISLEKYPDVIIENVHLGDSLMALCYEIAKND